MTASVSGTDVNLVENTTRAASLELQLPRVTQMELILTEACNLGCTYCFEYGANAAKSMSKDVARRAVDFLAKACRGRESVEIMFMGGEPLLQFDLISWVVDYSRSVFSRIDKQVRFSMQTNGVLLTEDCCRFFREHDVRYCLSLDGGALSNDRHRKTLGGTGTFQVLAEKMTTLKRFQHWQGARMTIMPDHADRVGDNIQELHEELAINQFIIGFATHVPWTDDRIAAYAHGLAAAFEYFVEQRVEKHSRRLRIGLFELGQINEAFTKKKNSGWGCGAGSGRLAVSPDGTFHGCSKLAWATSGGSAHAPLPLGSVGTGFSNPDNRLKLLNHTSEPRSKCQSCELNNHCSGGCYAASIADTGDMYTPADYYCRLMFAQKQVADYARSRLKELQIDNLYWTTDVADLMDPSMSHERIFDADS